MNPVHSSSCPAEAADLPDAVLARALGWHHALPVLFAFLAGALAVGGLLLIWIAWKLLQPEDGEGHEQGAGATTFWGAMRTGVRGRARTPSTPSPRTVSVMTEAERMSAISKPDVCA